jgi:putative Holliday junction resolvase
VDWGGKRLGLALSDPLDLTAQPLDTIQLTAPTDAAGAIARAVAEHGVTRIVLGLPLELSGKTGEAARAVLDLKAQLERMLAVPVETWDERFTSALAEQSLREEGVRTSHRKGGGRERARARTEDKARVDRRAAILLLQSWLDARRARSDRSGEPS